MCCALTDGFDPQSGLVQRGVINAACRPPPLVASPPPSPRRRWDNKAPRSCNLISCSKQSMGCCAPAQRGKGGAVRPPKGEKPPEVADSPPCQRDIRMGRENRNADFISIARRAIHHPLNPLNLLNPLNPFPAPFYTTCRRKAATTYGAKGPVNPHALRACSCRMAVPAAIWYNNTSALYREALINSQNRISYVFLSNAAS